MILYSISTYIAALIEDPPVAPCWYRYLILFHSAEEDKNARTLHLKACTIRCFDDSGTCCYIIIGVLPSKGGFEWTE
ncbi:hypothetical protein QCA50_014903 [Cerrena zonata]|uniref:Uncharacterized protein n=1 Tax=Cerrena zonata TaxID=2478898 RepID=A0AAW0FMA8_9APHY